MERARQDSNLRPSDSSMAPTPALVPSTVTFGGALPSHGRAPWLCTREPSAAQLLEVELLILRQSFLESQHLLTLSELLCNAA